jgi:hypothetical protein
MCDGFPAESRAAAAWFGAVRLAGSPTGAPGEHLVPPRPTRPCRRPSGLLLVALVRASFNLV